MGLFKKQNALQNKSNEVEYDNIIEEVNHCKSKDLEALLKKIEFQIENSGEKDRILLSAKTMVTSRIAVKNSSK